MKKVKLFSAILILSLISIGGYYWVQYQKQFPSTTDAYVKANQVYISPQIAGRVTKVLVKSYQSVAKGDLLIQIDAKPFELKIAQVQSQYQIVQAQIEQAMTAKKTAILQAVESQNRLHSAKSTYERIERLYHKNLASKQKMDDAFYKFNEAKAHYQATQSSILSSQNSIFVAQAKLKQVEVSIQQAKLNLSYTKIYAPQTGRLGKVMVRPGQFLVVGEKLFPMIETDYFWIVANFKETDLKRIKVGQQADIQVDMYPNHYFKGQVESISAASGVSFSLIPPQNATGNWVQVTQRFPVRIKINLSDHKDMQQLRLGASTSVTIDTQTPSKK